MLRVYKYLPLEERRIKSLEERVCVTALYAKSDTLATAPLTLLLFAELISLSPRDNRYDEKRNTIYIR